MSALRNIRTAKITQQGLGEKLGLPQATIGHYEKGRLEPRLSEARRLVTALNRLGAPCTLDEVFPPEEEEARKPLRGIGAGGGAPTTVYPRRGDVAQQALRRGR